MISKSEEIDIVQLFPELAGTVLYTQLAMVKQRIDKDDEGLTRDAATNLKGIPSFACFSLNWRLVRLLLTIPCVQ